MSEQDNQGSKELESQSCDNRHQEGEEVEEQVEEEGEEGEEEDELGEMDRYWPPPMEKTVEMIGAYGSKTVSAFTINNAGTRFACGGHDYEVRIWDFEILDQQRPQPIGNSQPCGQTVVKNLDYSNDDELILAVSGSCQAQILAKDGIVSKQYLCAKGDQYLSDMANTKGHVQMLNDGCWNPKDKQTFITCSNDATIRIWDLNKLSQQKTVIKTRSPGTGLKAVPNVCNYTRDSLAIIAGCNDGSIMMWDTRKKFITTSTTIRNAHLKGSEITGIDFSYGLNKICTRSEDESCKIWDMRQLKIPLASRTGLTTLYSTTDCCFSPDDQLVLTGTSHAKNEPGQLLFLSTDNLETKESIGLEDSSVIRVRWHPKINHIGFSCSNGTIHVAYDGLRSIGGFLATSANSEKKRKKYIGQRATNTSGGGTITRIITPHALPLYRDDQNKSKKKMFKCEMPIAGQGGYIRPVGSTLSSYIARNLVKKPPDQDK